MPGSWQRISRNRVLAAAVSALLVGAAVVAVSSTRFFRIVELNGFDRLIGLQRESPPVPEIVFVDITDATVREYGHPFPRDKVAQTIERIATGAPELIGLDMLLPESRGGEQDQALVPG